MMLFVAGLASDFDDVDLKEMFELYGEVASAKLITDRATGKSKGFGFVEMINEVEAKETITILDGVMLQRKKISVKEAEAQQPRTNSGGGYNSGGFNNNRSYNNNNTGYNNDRPRKPYNAGGNNGDGGSGYNNNNTGGGSTNGGSYNRDRNNDSRNRDNNDDKGGFNKRY